MNSTIVLLETGAYEVQREPFGEDADPGAVIAAFMEDFLKEDFVATLNYSLERGDVLPSEAAEAVAAFNESGPDAAIKVIFQYHPELFNEDSAAAINALDATAEQTD